MRTSRTQRTRTSQGISVGYLPPPVDFGAPKKFSSWRSEQEEALVLSSESRNRVSILNMPTGSGKTLYAYMYCIITGQRGLILTETKGLEDQYDFDVGLSAGGELVDIRGANNYPCPALESGGFYSNLRNGSAATCDKGPCRTGMPCKLRDGGCPYYDKLAQAREAPVVVSNYANWLSIGKSKRDDDKEDVLGEFDVIILDELHGAADQVSRALTVELALSELSQHFGGHLPNMPTSDSIRDWKPWILALKAVQSVAMDGAQVDLKMAKDHGYVNSATINDVRYLRRLSKELQLLEEAVKDRSEWVVERSTSYSGKAIVTFQPVWPGPYCEKYLFRGIKRVIGMSATVTQESMKYLGLKPNSFDYWEFESSFPISNRPIYFLPSVFMHHGMTSTQYSKWARTIDTIARVHAHDKGIVHTVSYERAKLYMGQSSDAVRSRLVQNSSSSTANVVENYKRSPEPLVLVSPSVGTGYDFPDDYARWQVIGKVPFVDKRSKIMKRRCDSDKGYANYLAMSSIVQLAGRIVRSVTDYGVTYIIDATFWDWYQRNKKYSPKHFQEGVKRIGSIPRPMNRSKEKEL